MDWLWSWIKNDLQLFLYSRGVVFALILLDFSLSSDIYVIANRVGIVFYLFL